MASTPTRAGLLVLMVFPVLALAIGIFLWEPVWLFRRGELGTGKEIVARVEAFRLSHGRLPEELKEVGIDDADLTVFYRKDGHDEYLVWFGRFSLGESEIYSSRTKKWE
jgi:hypothetical protein